MKELSDRSLDAMKEIRLLNSSCTTSASDDKVSGILDAIGW